MSIDFPPADVDELTPRISVIGVGGAGGNAIANMIHAEVQGVEFLVANTDAQALKQSEAGSRIQLGAKITQGLGAGSRPEIGRAAAEETIEQVQKALEGSHMCFIAAGMGGGTGTGAAPVIAKAARDMGILTVGVVTKPFSFEGKRRAKAAEAGIEELQKFVDTLIVIPNQNLFLIADANTTFKQAFELADEVLQQGVRGITDLMVMPGLINLDFADVRSVMQEAGKAMMGTGEADGDGRAIEAAQQAIANPLLDGVSLNGAKGVIVSISGGDDMRLLEVDEAAHHIRQLVDEDANIIWGSSFNPELEGKIRVSVVATGIEQDGEGTVAAAPAEPARTFTFSAPRRPSGAMTIPAPTGPRGAGAAATTAHDAADDSDAGDSDTAPVPTEADAGTPPVPSEYAPTEADDAKEPDADKPAAVFDDADDDELVLGAETMVPPSDSAPAPKEDDDTPKPMSGRRRWLTSGPDDDGDDAPKAAPAASSKPGGTLFERMANSGRASSSDDSDDDKGGLDIPRFLHRQNNQ